LLLENLTKEFEKYGKNKIIPYGAAPLSCLSRVHPMGGRRRRRRRRSLFVFSGYYRGTQGARC